MPLNEADLTKLLADYMHAIEDILKRQDTLVYVTKLARLQEMDRKLAEHNLKISLTVSTTVSTEAFAEHKFEEKDLRHLTEKDL